MVFGTSPTYVEVVARVKEFLKWTDPRENVELEGRHFVGSGHHTRKKKIPITCELDWGHTRRLWRHTKTSLLNYLLPRLEVIGRILT